MLNENVIVYLNNLISERQNNTQDIKLKEKLQILKNKISNGIFFEIDFDTAVKLLKVIGVKEEEIIDIYAKIMSYKNYQYFNKDKVIELVDVEHYKSVTKDN